MNGINKKIYYNGLFVAYTTALTYMHGMHGEKKKTKWVMHEYRIDPSYLRLPPQVKSKYFLFFKKNCMYIVRRLGSHPKD